MKQFIIFFTFILTLPFNSYAGNSSAGGDGVIINGKTYLLDFVEANIHEKIYFRNPQDYSPGVAQAISDKVGIDIETGRLISSKLGELYDKNVVLEFLIKWKILNLDWLIVPRDLIHVRDEDTVFEFNNHELVQLAVRQDSTVYINQDQWELLDVVTRAGLIIHEAMYSLHDSFNENDHYSPPARRLTSLFFDRRLETITGERFHFVLNREGLSFSNPLTGGNVLLVKKEMGNIIRKGSVVFGYTGRTTGRSPIDYYWHHLLHEYLIAPSIAFNEDVSACAADTMSGPSCLPTIKNWPDGNNEYEKAKSYFKAVQDGDERTTHKVYQKGDIF